MELFSVRVGNSSLTPPFCNLIWRRGGTCSGEWRFTEKPNRLHWADVWELESFHSFTRGKEIRKKTLLCFQKDIPGRGWGHLEGLGKQNTQAKENTELTILFDRAGHYRCQDTDGEQIYVLIKQSDMYLQSQQVFVHSCLARHCISMLQLFPLLCFHNSYNIAFWNINHRNRPLPGTLGVKQFAFTVFIITSPSWSTQCVLSWCRHWN